MKKVKFLLATISFISFIGLTNSCSQSSGASVQSSFEATTPCDETVKKMLGIPAGTKCEMMRWKLTFYRDSQKLTPASFSLVCEYGMPKQGTRGFMEGANKIELKGKWTTGKDIRKNNRADVYTLMADSRGISLSFLQPDPNLLHLLNEDKSLVKGNGAWSYTFNRTEPIRRSLNNFTPRAISQTVVTGGSDTIGIFEGRTPCNSALTELKNISENGCQIIKCRLILFQDMNTHTPSTFLLQTIYVGKGDTKYGTTGKWKLMQGTVDDPAAVVYQLEPDTGKSPAPLLLLKADDNILFFIDNDTHLMVGNNYCSYTLNRTKK